MGFFEKTKNSGNEKLLVFQQQPNLHGIIFMLINQPREMAGISSEPIAFGAKLL
jgi:hypothetical protein